MSDLEVRRGLGRRSRRATAVIAAAAACLMATGCSAVKSAVNHAASAQAPQPATTGTGTSGTGLKAGWGAAASAFASATTSVLPPNPLGPPADPFTGTPADHWADGAAGIMLPAAAPVAPHTKGQVEKAHQTNPALLLPAELEKQTLLGGAPTAFADLLTSPQKAWFTGGLNKKGVDKQGFPQSTRTLVMSFTPGSAQLIGSAIKVHGTMRAQAVRVDGNLQLNIDVDYIFVYPIEPPHQPDDWMRIVNEVAWTVAFGNWKGVSSTFAPWVTSDGTTGGVAGADCGSTDGYSHPDYPASTAPGAQPSVSPSGTPVDPYVAGQSREGTCQETTGT